MTQVVQTVGFKDELIHVYDFYDRRILNEEDSYKCVHNGKRMTILGARKKFPHSATQMTVTDSQLRSYDHGREIKKYLTNHGFSQVFAHKNPNTGRIVYTLMAPPLEKPAKEARRPLSKEYYSNLYKRICTGPSYHMGGCCGVSHLNGIDPTKHGRDCLDNIKDVFGKMYSQDRVRKAFFFLLPESATSSSYNYTLLEKLHYSIGTPVYSWRSGVFGDVMNMYMFSPNKVDSNLHSI